MNEEKCRHRHGKVRSDRENLEVLVVVFPSSLLYFV
jgi:hypothetical protein